MTHFRPTPQVLLAFTFMTGALLTGTPSAFAQSNLSDITGPNVSDITGPNVSDITGPNVSDITGTDTAEARAYRAGLNGTTAQQLADDLGATYGVCAGGGSCTDFYTLYDQATSIIH